ncbi:MAG: hypothetical protein H0V18_06275 [Pyrinomonadaceae bacterium]|jgi:hypothetical protein|nr:hypothetical protein [Pyrinomonadaceae bacterium]
MWASRLTLIALIVLGLSVSTDGQIPTSSSAHNIQSEVEKSDPRVSQIIAWAEDHFQKGKLNLENNKREQAHDEFDKAIDTILESGLDVRASQRLQTFYLELIERIYREEVLIGHGPTQVNNPALIAQNSQSTTQPPPQIGFLERRFEPSPLDELSKLVLTLKNRRSKFTLRTRKG